jgi:hypothetical protein
MYQQAWKSAVDDHAGFVYIDSWNDFATGSEVASSREYGGKYADQTRLWAIAFNGDKEWHAKFLMDDAPRVILPKTLYTVSLRVENAGTLPWRAGEGYSLCPRWYKDGRLFDDSAPRVPISSDVFPGQMATLSTGLAARNNFGEDLEPGDYVLVFDIVQGVDKWFSYAGDDPIQIPVTVLAADKKDAAHPRATFDAAETPTSGRSGGTYQAHVTVRNDGPAAWSAKTHRLAWRIMMGDASYGEQITAHGVAPLPSDIGPGDMAEIDTPIVLADSSAGGLKPGDYRIDWSIVDAGDKAVPSPGYAEPIRVTPSDNAASFVLADIPRNLDAGEEATARLAVRNVGREAWLKDAVKIGYHWYYLDGTELAWDGGVLTPLKADVAPGALAADVAAKFRAPSEPGRYALVWDVMASDGTWLSTAGPAKGNDLLQALVNVGGKGRFVPVDLAKVANAGAPRAYGKAMGVPLDGSGDAIPAEFLPPDGASEVETNPFLLGKAASPLYPSGYYAGHGADGSAGNHGVPFRYPVKSGENSLVACTGQEIALPAGKYRAIHILAAATGGAPAPASLTLRYDGGDEKQSVAFSDWRSAPQGPQATPGLIAPYVLTDSDADPTACILGDYGVPVSPERTLRALALPQAPVKIVAITLEK